MQAFGTRASVQNRSGLGGLTSRSQKPRLPVAGPNEGEQSTFLEGAGGPGQYCTRTEPEGRSLAPLSRRDLVVPIVRQSESRVAHQHPPVEPRRLIVRELAPDLQDLSVAGLSGQTS